MITAPANFDIWKMPEPVSPDPFAISVEDDLSRVEVQLVGNGFQVDGRLMIGRFERLSDWLNMQQGWIHAENATLIQPGHESPDDRKCDKWVRLEQVILVSEHREKQLAKPTGAYIQKERRRVTIVTAGYTLRGFVHLHADGSMQTFLESTDTKFIPMTDVVVRWLADETLVSHYPFALINREQMISVSDEPVAEAAGANTEDVAVAVDAEGEPPPESTAWLPRSA